MSAHEQHAHEDSDLHHFWAKVIGGVTVGVLVGLAVAVVASVSGGA